LYTTFISENRNTNDLKQEIERYKRLNKDLLTLNDKLNDIKLKEEYKYQKHQKDLKAIIYKNNETKK